MAQGISLNTERLLLRPIKLADADAIFAYSSDETWARYHDKLPNMEMIEEFVAQHVLAPWTDDPRFSIILDSEVVGGLGLTIDRKYAHGELAYSLAREHWGKGLVIEAARKVVRWGFEELGLAKVWTRADALNTQSTRVMEKLGMTLEGVLRAQTVVRGERRDEVRYGLLRDEWVAGDTDLSP
jgi:[ribosomal protein S5]-alanine N-acetyltransferase